MKNKILISVGILSVFLGAIFGVSNGQVSAVKCSASFLGFQAWYSDLEMTDCKKGTIDSNQYKGDDGLAKLVWTIVLNIMADISIAVGVLATVFVMYGGYLYIMSKGEPDKTAKGKITIRNAIIGIIIAIGAGVIVFTVKTILTA